MRMSDIHENAKRCIALHGNKAELIAKQKAEECERHGNETDARNWQRVRAVIREMKAPHSS
ncbi:MAG: hypothetical protein WBP94_00225 [Rhodomicrobiaceae bacterium]